MFESDSVEVDLDSAREMRLVDQAEGEEEVEAADEPDVLRRRTIGAVVVVTR